VLVAFNIRAMSKPRGYHDLMKSLFIKLITRGHHGGKKNIREITYFRFLNLNLMVCNIISFPVKPMPKVGNSLFD
jgi:hypothetical protein